MEHAHALIEAGNEGEELRVLLGRRAVGEDAWGRSSVAAAPDVAYGSDGTPMGAAAVGEPSPTRRPAPSRPAGSLRSNDGPSRGNF